MRGEHDLGTISDDNGTSRVRFCQRPDRLFTYYVEARRQGSKPGGPPAGNLHWALVRDGGLFTEEDAMRREARLGLTWSGL